MTQLTYKVTAAQWSMWHQIIRAESHHEALAISSQVSGIPIKELSAQLCHTQTPTTNQNTFVRNAMH
jgi:hypothetical protein